GVARSRRADAHPLRRQRQGRQRRGAALAAGHRRRARRRRLARRAGLRQDHRGGAAARRAREMTADPIYLDHNASTPVPPRVRQAMMAALEEGFGNPSATHAYGRRARAIVERARSRVAALIGCDDDEIVFTGGGTEANNLAIRGFAMKAGGPITL